MLLKAAPREGAARLEKILLPETNFRKLHWKQVFQHAMTLLSPWMNGHSEREIAEMLGIREMEVRRDLEWALELIKQRESRWRGTKPPESIPEIDQMPATICSKCEGAIPCGEYRIAVLAVACDRNSNGEDISEAIRKLTICGGCAVSMSEFTIVNDIKRTVEERAASLTLPSPPGTDALDNWRAKTGHGELPSDDGPTAICDPKYDPGDEKSGRADAEAIELSEWGGWGKPDRSELPSRLLRSTDSVRRETLRNFLMDRKRSWGKMQTRMRQAATLFVEGKTQKEIAQQVGVDQATVSRMIQGALRIAGAAA